MLATFIGVLSLIVLPGIGPFVALPSGQALAPLKFRDIPQLVVRLIAYSLFPGSVRHWFDISWVIFWMSIVSAGRMTERQYAQALVTGSLAGGVAFVLSSHAQALIGPTMAAYGVVGFHCVFTLRSWRELGLLARLFSAGIAVLAAYTVVTAFADPPGTRLAERAATIVSIVVAIWSLRSPGERVAHAALTGDTS